MTDERYIPPSRSELEARIRRQANALPLYQAGHEWFSFEHGGTLYHIPPDLGEGELSEHPVTGEPVVANGILLVRDRYGMVLDAKTRKPLGLGDLEGQSANAIVLYVLENYSERGIVLLENDGKDDARKTAARKLLHKFSRTWAEHERTSRSEFVANWLQIPANKGKVPPPPTARQIKAQELLDEMRVTGRQGAEFICKHGCYESGDFVKYARHMKAEHNEVVAPPEDAEPKRRSKKDSQEQPAV